MGSSAASPKGGYRRNGLAYSGASVLVPLLVMATSWSLFDANVR